MAALLLYRQILRRDTSLRTFAAQINRQDLPTKKVNQLMTIAAKFLKQKSVCGDRPVLESIIKKHDPLFNFYRVVPQTEAEWVITLNNGIVEFKPYS